ncbi:MAG: right-handed parallel beta-helix repeat-containing protein, partial [Candidatus Marinimicrobia bacterium]|nr:right-handed parallel beta-helix repeat-containing protein [Candidatus Neomarinimicrobiota bacterium]
MALPLAILGSVPVDALALYVSPIGDDGLTGRSPVLGPSGAEGPFATLERARDEIRIYRWSKGRLPAGGVSVLVHGGAYEFASTLELGPEDSGTPESPIIYQSYGSDTVRLSGSRRIPVARFAPVTDKVILERLPGPAREAVVQVNLFDQGITDFGRLTPRGKGRATKPAALELFISGRAMPRARWPDEGWVEILQTPKGQQGDMFVYDGRRPARWAENRDIWLHGYWTHPWADSYVRVVAIDTARHEFRTNQPHGIYGYSVGGRYYAFNILEELDQPGEWYLDRETGWLFLWPPESFPENDIYVSLLESPLLQCRETEWVQFHGFTFEATRGNGIELHDSRHVALANCTVCNTGNTGILIAGGESCGIRDSELHQTGEGGIILRGGDRASLKPGGHYVIGNNIHNYARWVRTLRPAVRLGGV